MAWRQSSPVSLNLDSLLDTMTNGVGILIIVLCVTQVEVSRLAGQAKSTGAKVSPGELKDIESKRLELEEALKKLQEEWRIAEPKQLRAADELKRLEALIARLKELLKQKPPRGDLAEIRKQIEDSERELREIEEKMAQKEKALREKKNELATLKDSTKQPPTGEIRELRVPQVYDLPEGTIPVFFFCRYGQLFPLDKDIGAKLMAGVRAAVKKPHGDIELGPGDPDRIADHFKKNDIGTRFIHIKVASVAGLAAKMTLEVRKGVPGETPEEFLKPTSRYAAVLREARLASPPKVVKFMVWADSFEAYIRARNMLDAQKIPGAWTPLADDEEYEEFLGGGPSPGRHKGD